MKIKISSQYGNIKWKMFRNIQYCGISSSSTTHAKRTIKWKRLLEFESDSCTIRAFDIPSSFAYDFDAWLNFFKVINGAFISLIYWKIVKWASSSLIDNSDPPRFLASQQHYLHLNNDMISTPPEEKVIGYDERERHWRLFYLLILAAIAAYALDSSPSCKYFLFHPTRICVITA